MSKIDLSSGAPRPAGPTGPISSGFSVFSLDHAQHIRTMRQKLNMIRASCVESLIDGSAKDYADYRRLVGRLEGIDDALHACDEIEKAERA